jgi:hypothetical protein
LIGNLLNVSTIAGFSPITFIDAVYFKSTIYALSSIGTNTLEVSTIRMPSFIVDSIKKRSNRIIHF